MAGIFFEGGVSCSLTINAQCNVGISGDCAALYYSPRCNVGVNPLQMNAVISELINAINVVNVGSAPSLYDCTRLDNLAEVLRNIRSLCNQPTLTANIDISDRIAGCFDNQSGTITVGELLDWLMQQFAVICDLEAAENPQRDNTLVAACVAGEERSLDGFQIGQMGVGGKGYRYYDMLALRTNSVWYQNKTPLPIEINVTCRDDAGLHYSAEGPGVNSVLINRMQADGMPLTAIIPPGHWYSIMGAGRYQWTELRLEGTQNDT